MTDSALRLRLAALERQMAELQAARGNGTHARDWRSTVGMFSGDDVMKEIDEAARVLREADRRRARRGAKRKARVKK
jgi:hypothetical protein